MGIDDACCVCFLAEIKLAGRNIREKSEFRIEAEAEFEI